jgi:NADH:ubiquinone oxidoreductase subunit
MQLLVKFFLKRINKFIGQDEYGNKYYESKSQTKWGRKKRFFIPKGKNEPTKIPASWHGWIHYKNELPLENSKVYKWQKDHIPNLTGKKKALRHSIQTKKKYESWKPNEV